MKKSELIKLAQQGHPQAIALLLNHDLQSHDIQATVGEHAGTLHILLESQKIPPQETYGKIIYQGLQKLAIATIDKAHIYGRTTGDREFAWKTVVSLREQTILDQSQVSLSSSRFSSLEPVQKQHPNPQSVLRQKQPRGWRFCIGWLIVSLGSSAIVFTIFEVIKQPLEPDNSLPQLAIASLTFCAVSSAGLLVRGQSLQRHP